MGPPKAQNAKLSEAHKQIYNGLNGYGSQQQKS